MYRSITCIKKNAQVLNVNMTCFHWATSMLRKKVYSWCPRSPCALLWPLFPTSPLSGSPLPGLPVHRLVLPTLHFVSGLTYIFKRPGSSVSVNILIFWGIRISVVTIQPCHCSPKVATNNA